MCSRHAEVGAGDPETMPADRTLEGYIPPPTYRPFRCLVKDIEGPAFWVTVNAMGRNDARGLARMAAYDRGAAEPGVIAIEEAA